MARGSKTNVLKIIPETRDFTVVFVPFFGHFRPDFIIRAQDRVPAAAGQVWPERWLGGARSENQAREIGAVYGASKGA